MPCSEKWSEHDAPRALLAIWQSEPSSRSNRLQVSREELRIAGAILGDVAGEEV